MNKIFKISGIILASILVILYLSFLVLPLIINNCFHLENYKKDIQKIAKETAYLSLDYSKIKLFTTPLLSIGATIDDLNIKLEDNSNLFSSKKIKAGISLPSLLTLTVKTSRSYIDNPNINLEIINDKNYKIISLVEKILKESQNNKKPEAKEQPEFVNNLIKKITIKVPSIEIKNYDVKVVDLKSKHNLNLLGEKLSIGYHSRKNSMFVKTNAKLLSDNKENINANINLKAKLAKAKNDNNKKVTKNTGNKTLEFPFVNIVKMYQIYDLKTNIDTNINFKQSKNKDINLNGYLNMDNLSLKLSEKRLPDSYLHAKFQNKNVYYDTNLYSSEKEKLELKGKLNLSKHPSIETTIKSTEIHFDNLINLVEAFLESASIKNDLYKLKATGFIKADTKIKSNFKKLVSNGLIIIKDGGILDTITKFAIKEANINLLFNDNCLKLDNSSLLINNSKVLLSGFIDNKSNTDIKIDSNNLDLANLFNNLAPFEIKKQINLNSGILTTKANIKGKLNNLNANLNLILNNFNLSDGAKTINIKNNNLNLDLDLNAKSLKGKINNSGLNINLAQLATNLKVNNADIDIIDSNITINPLDLIYNDKSKINIEGKILSFIENPNLDINLKGILNTKNISQTLGREIAYYIPSKGIIPFKANVSGNIKTQKLIAQIYSDSNNYITPINFKELFNKKTITQLKVELNKDKIKIIDSGLFKVESNFTDNLNKNMKNAVKLVDINALIEKDKINSLKITIPEALNGSIAIFNKSTFTTKGKIHLWGKFDKLSYGGDLKISNINIPELLSKVGSVDLNLISEGLDIKAKDLNINGTDLNITTKINLKSIKMIKIENLNIMSNTINVDKLLKTLDNLMKYAPKTNAKPKQAQTTQANIPIYANGKIDIKKLITGNIVVENIKSDLEIKNNILYLKNLTCNAFKGSVNGEIRMNLLSTLLTIKLTGKNIDSQEALLKAANMKDIITGNLNFKTDISLKGTTYQEQIKSLKGEVNFELTNGQYGPFAKLENFFLAENIRNNAFFKNTIGTILTPLATIDSTHYEKLVGKVNFNNGVVKLDSIASRGDVLCALINGNFNLLTNYIDAKVKVRLASVVSDKLGPLSVANPINLVKNTPGLNVAGAKLFTIFSEATTEKELNEIPHFSKGHTDKNATKFQIILRGSVLKPYTIVKSFKWLVSHEEMDKANTFSKNFILEQQAKVKDAVVNTLQTKYEQSTKLKSGVQNAIKTNEQIKKTKEALSKEQMQKNNEMIKKQAQEAVNNRIQNSKDILKSRLHDKLIQNKQ